MFQFGVYARAWQTSCHVFQNGLAMIDFRNCLWELSVWYEIVRACCDPSSDRYAFYGGRRVTLCDRWTDFASFLADVGKAEPSTPVLARIDLGGNFDPGNVRWAPQFDENSAFL
jgi:hypothetical protein